MHTQETSFSLPVCKKKKLRLPWKPLYHQQLLGHWPRVRTRAKCDDLTPFIARCLFLDSAPVSREMCSIKSHNTHICSKHVFVDLLASSPLMGLFFFHSVHESGWTNVFVLKDQGRCYRRIFGFCCPDQPSLLLPVTKGKGGARWFVCLCVCVYLSVLAPKYLMNCKTDFVKT